MYRNHNPIVVQFNVQRIQMISQYMEINFRTVYTKCTWPCVKSPEGPKKKELAHETRKVRTNT